MPDKKITDLGDGGLPQPTDDFVVARGATNNKIAWSSMAAAATEGNVAIAGSNTTYTSGTVVLTGAGGGVTVGSNAGQQIEISVAAPVAQSVQTQNVVDLTLDGNTAGALQLVSSGTLTLAGGNNITLSQAGNAITISGPNAGGVQTGISGLMNSEATYTSGTVELVQTGAITIASNAGQQFVFSVNPQSVQPETQTFVAGISASDTLYTSGNVVFTGSNAATVKSGAGQKVIIDVPVQSTQIETQTFIGGISASDTLYTSGTVRITGVGGGVTVSSNTGQRIDISVAAQSVQPETQTFIGGVSASDTLYTSGSVRFTGSNAVTVKSGTGQLVVIDSPVQTEQTQSRFNLTLSGNSTSAGAGYIQISSGVMTLAGGNNVTLSQNGNAVTISGPNVGGAQTGISGIANSETTYTSGTVSLSELGALTIRSTTGNQFQFSVPPISSISASTNITISADGSTLKFSVADPVAQTNQAGSVYASSNTFGTSSGTYDARTLSIAGSGNVSVAASNSGWVISVPASAAQTNQAGSVYAISNTSGTSSGTYDARTLSIAGAGIVTVAASNSGWRINASQSVQAGSVYASSNTFGTSSGTYDARTLSIAGSGAVSVAASNSGWVISAPIAVAQTNQAGSVYAISNTSGTSSGTYDARTLSIAGAGIVTVAASNSGWRIDATTAAQTNQAGSVYASSNTFGTSSGTYDARSISIAGRGAVSVAASNSGWIISAPAQTAQSGISAIYDGANSISTGTVSMANANGVSFSVNGNTLSGSVNQSISMFAVSNTTQSTSGTAHKSALSFGGAGVASVGVTGGSVVISVPAGGGAGYSAGVSTGGNTAGSTGITGSNLVLVGTNMISLSQSTGANGGTVSINATQSVQTQGVPLMGVSTGGATSGDTTVNSGTRFVLVGTNVTMSQGTAANATTVTVSAPATSSLSATGGIQISTNGSTISIGDGGQTAAYWENMPAMEGVLYTHISGVSKVPFYWPEFLPLGIKPANIALRVSQVTASADLSVSVHFGIYTFVNSTSAALLGSASDAFVVSNGSSVSFSAQRNWVLTSPGTVAAISSLSAGNYLFGCMFSASATGAMNASIYAASAAVGPRVGRIMPGTNQLSTATSQGIAGLYGRGSTTVNAMPANVQASEVVNQGIGASSPMKPYIFIRS